MELVGRDNDPHQGMQSQPHTKALSKVASLPSRLFRLMAVEPW